MAQLATHQEFIASSTPWHVAFGSERPAAAVASAAGTTAVTEVSSASVAPSGARAVLGVGGYSRPRRASWAFLSAARRSSAAFLSAARCEVPGGRFASASRCRELPRDSAARTRASASASTALSARARVEFNLRVEIMSPCRSSESGAVRHARWPLAPFTHGQLAGAWPFIFARLAAARAPMRICALAE